MIITSFIIYLEQEIQLPYRVVIMYLHNIHVTIHKVNIYLVYRNILSSFDHAIKQDSDQFIMVVKLVIFCLVIYHS